jgi:hypothetical protein
MHDYTIATITALTFLAALWLVKDWNLNVSVWFRDLTVKVGKSVQTVSGK